MNVATQEDKRRKQLDTTKEIVLNYAHIKVLMDFPLLTIYYFKKKKFERTNSCSKRNRPNYRKLFELARG